MHSGAYVPLNSLGWLPLCGADVMLGLAVVCHILSTLCLAVAVCLRMCRRTHQNIHRVPQGQLHLAVGAVCGQCAVDGQVLNLL